MSCYCHVKESWTISPFMKLITIIFSFSNEDTINWPEPYILIYFEKSPTDGVAFTKICTYYHTNVTCGKFLDGFCIVKAIKNFPKGMFNPLYWNTHIIAVFTLLEVAWSLFPFSTCLPPGITLGSPPSPTNTTNQCILYLDGTKRKLIAKNPKGRTRDVSITLPLSGKLCAFLTSQFIQACLMSSDLILWSIPFTSVLQYYIEYWTLSSSYAEGAGKAIDLCLQSLLDFLSRVCVWDTWKSVSNKAWV